MKKGVKIIACVSIEVLKAKRGNSKERIITIYVSNTQSQYTLAAKHLQGIIEIIESIRSDVIIRECHERGFSFIHNLREVGVGDG